MRVFVDTNVLLDVLRNRQPFVKDSQAVWLLAEKREVTGLVSTLSFANIFYIAQKQTDATNATQLLRQMRSVFLPVACDMAVLDQALAAGFSDFEDALQYFSATGASSDCIVTRNAKHFPVTALPILSPEQFLATL
jgi:predicted nucleic acid-binding protein